MVLRTNRLILRNWKESDADDLYKYASDPDIGPSCGWPPHQDIAESLNIIKNVLIGEELYAVCLQEDDKAIGDIKLKLKHSDVVKRDDECEVGCWTDWQAFLGPRFNVRSLSGSDATCL